LALQQTLDEPGQQAGRPLAGEAGGAPEQREGLA